MVFVNEGNLPLLARVYLSVAYLFNGIFKKVFSSDFNFLHFALIAIVILGLNSHATLSKQLCSDVKIVHPGNITDKMLTNDMWDLSKVHFNTMLFQIFVDDPEIITEKLQSLVSADES